MQEHVLDLDKSEHKLARHSKGEYSYTALLLRQLCVMSFTIRGRSQLEIEQSEHIGQCDTPHHLSDVRRGAPSCFWDYFSHSDVTICVLNAI